MPRVLYSTLRCVGRGKLMYEELVKRLRHDSESRALMEDAADAIEELSRMEQNFRQYISDQVNREKGVYACCYCKHRESTNKYESGCTLEKCDGVSGWAWGVPKEE